MAGNLPQINQAQDEEEYVLLDLGDVCVDADIPANAPYVLSVRNYLLFIMTTWITMFLCGSLLFACSEFICNIP